MSGMKNFHIPAEVSVYWGYCAGDGSAFAMASTLDDISGEKSSAGGLAAAEIGSRQMAVIKRAREIMLARIQKT